MISTTQLTTALDKISERIGLAQGSFYESYYSPEESHASVAEWQLEVAFVQLLVITEALQLPLLRAEIANSFAAGKQEGLLAEGESMSGPPEAKWISEARRYWAALNSSFNSNEEHTITKDLESILRESLYSITDTAIFPTTPEEEADVHKRLENLLRCIFPDLVRKPRLGKPIKNFEPDTGIPSIKTLIEYKFLSDQSQVSPLADQILADTRGYISPEWNSFVYVIYETEPFQSEAQWRHLLRKCHVETTTTVVVLTGKSIVTKKKTRHRAHLKTPTEVIGS